MTQHEALTYLGITNLADAKDALEEELFLLRQQIISKGNLPQLLLARRKKLQQLEKVAITLNLKIKKKHSDLNINNLNTLNIFQAFNLFQKNKAIILQQTSIDLSFENLEMCIDKLIFNLKMYCSLWPELITENEEQVITSKELDSMEMLRILKELESKNIGNFSALTSFEIPEALKKEIRRLNAVRKQFD